MFNLIVGVILIDIPIFDVHLGVIVQRQPAIGRHMEEEKIEILHALHQSQNQRPSHLAISIVSVILIDMPIFDVHLGVIVGKLQTITSLMVDVKIEILHALDQRQKLM